MTIEKLTKKIIQECEKDGEPVTEEEAKQMAEMELNSKNIHRYEKSETPRKPTTRERKIDENKFRILKNCKVLLEGMQAVNAQLINETEIAFTFNDEE